MKSVADVVQHLREVQVGVFVLNLGEPPLPAVRLYRAKHQVYIHGQYFIDTSRVPG